MSPRSQTQTLFAIRWASSMKWSKWQKNIILAFTRLHYQSLTSPQWLILVIVITKVEQKCLIHTPPFLLHLIKNQKKETNDVIIIEKLTEKTKAKWIYLEHNRCLIHQFWNNLFSTNNLSRKMPMHNRCIKYTTKTSHNLLVVQISKKISFKEIDKSKTGVSELLTLFPPKSIPRAFNSHPEYFVVRKGKGGSM